jgi:hypothetical protein
MNAVVYKLHDGASMLRRLSIALLEYFMLFMGLGFLAFLCLGWSLFAVVSLGSSAARTHGTPVGAVHHHGGLSLLHPNALPVGCLPL